MTAPWRAWTAILAGSLILVAGCASVPARRHAPVQPPPSLPSLPAPPVAPETVPDAQPKAEPRSAFGNPPFYDQFGRRYVVLASSAGYVERGVASWYGPGFHAVRTSTHEPYDMYGMTAAHKTLPLPCYVRVTNLQNGRSVVVRVNDRGPFVDNRIIDLSYTAAAKLDMLRNGTAIVEVRSIETSEPAPTPAPVPANATLYVQAGAFADPANAERLLARLRGSSFGNVFIRENMLAGRKLYRVRIGPVPDVAEFDRVVAALEQEGVHDAHLAFD
ncbi:MAG: septal ring lytic transglycosylase RlpA family protein [Steroidobacterales bacterium]